MRSKSEFNTIESLMDLTGTYYNNSSAVMVDAEDAVWASGT